MMNLKWSKKSKLRKDQDTQSKIYDLLEKGLAREMPSHFCR